MLSCKNRGALRGFQIIDSQSLIPTHDKYDTGLRRDQEMIIGPTVEDQLFVCEVRRDSAKKEEIVKKKKDRPDLKFVILAIVWVILVLLNYQLWCLFC